MLRLEATGTDMDGQDFTPILAFPHRFRLLVADSQFIVFYGVSF